MSFYCLAISEAIDQNHEQEHKSSTPITFFLPAALGSSAANDVKILRFND